MKRQIVTHKYRIRNLTGELNRMARAVNYVWNYANDVQKHALKWDKKWPSGFDLTYKVSGSGPHFMMPQDFIYATVLRYAKSRRNSNKAFLKYRGRKSLGWVPLTGRSIKSNDNGFKVGGKLYKVWISRALPKGKIVDGGSFSQDSRGRWYINIPVEVEVKSTHDTGKFIGIDLGLKDFATLSNGEKIGIQQIYRKSQVKLAVAQRAHKKRQVTKIHAKIAAQRRDFHHNASADIAKRFGFIAVGNVSASKLAKTKMAKSVLDAGWSDFRNMLLYKSIRNGGKYIEVNEAYSPQTCSSCGCLPASRPGGIAGLGIREWTCDDCGSVHDRDVNAAINILRNAHVTLGVGAVN